MSVDGMNLVFAFASIVTLAILFFYLYSLLKDGKRKKAEYRKLASVPDDCPFKPKQYRRKNNLY